MRVRSAKELLETPEARHATFSLLTSKVLDRDYIESQTEMQDSFSQSLIIIKTIRSAIATNNAKEYGIEPG